MFTTLRNILLVTLTFSCSHLALSETEEPDSLSYELMELSVVPKDYSAQVIWIVHNEQVGYVYIIEKSTDESNWTEKSRVTSEEVDSSYCEYNQAINDHIEAPVEHYRLKRMDNTGSEEILNTVTLYHNVLSKMELVSPPGQANKAINIEFISLLDLPVKLTVEDATGEIHYEKDFDAVKGENWHTLKLSKFKSGRYLIVIRDVHENKVQKSLMVY